VPMYSVNGVDLQSSELEGLNLLVAAEGEVRVAVLLPRITFISRARSTVSSKSILSSTTAYTKRA